MRFRAQCLTLTIGLLLSTVLSPVQGQSCSNPDTTRPENIEPTGKWRVFNQLTISEIDEVVDFLVRELGVFHIDRNGSDTFPTTAGPDILQKVELFEPVKAEVLEYLDNDGEVPKRYAKAYVLRSTSEPKDAMEYKVGPLPLTPGDRKPAASIGVGGDDSPVEGVVVERLLEDGEVPFTKRPPDAVTAGWTAETVIPEAYKIRKIFLDAVGACYGTDPTNDETRERGEAECGTDRLEWIGFPALDPDPTNRFTHIQWFFHPVRGGGDEMNLHSVPISFKINENDLDVEKWTAFDFEYCHQGPFETAEDLLSAYENDELIRCVAEDWKATNYDESWSRTNGRTQVRNDGDRPGPRTFYPAGERFTAKVDSRDSGTGFKVEYMGWEGHVSMRYDTGIVMHDIRFRGNRIVYELALQEQYVAYSGYAGGGQTYYMDSYFGMGLSTYPLRKGIDCPETAQYFRVVKNTGSLAYIDDDIICIFEEDAQSAEWRHVHFNGPSGPHADGARRSVLVIRTIATVGNYDYIYSIRLRPDASIEVDTTLAGYMVTSFFDINGQTGKNAPFGTRVQKYTLATLHDHLSGWKVDLDVLGTKNSVWRTSVKAGTWEEALANAGQPGAKSPPWHSASIVKYIQREQVESEFGFLIRDPGTVIHSITNDKFTNQFGEPRGYTIMHGMTARQVLPDTHPLTKAAAWTKYHLAVTKRKEDEPVSHASIYDAIAPGDPVVSLDDFLDGESIVDEDLVAWVMMGVVHVPKSEDVPLISNFGTQFFIKPWNYYDELASMDAGHVDAFESCRPVVGNNYNYDWSFTS